MFNTPFSYFGDSIRFETGVIYVGEFLTFNGASFPRIYSSLSTTIESQIPNFNIGTGFGGGQIIKAVSDRLGRIICVGFFTSYKGVTANRIIRILPNGDRDTSFDIGTGFNGDTRAVFIDSDNKIYVCGNFSTYRGAAVNRMVRLNENGTRDLTFVPPSFDNVVLEGTILDNKPVVVGTFTTPSNRIVGLTSVGGVDSSFNVGGGFNDFATSITKDSSNKLYITGNFTTYRGVSAVRFVKINSDGSRDTSFDVGTGFNNETRSCTILPDNSVLVGGRQTAYRGTTRPFLTKILSNGTIDSGFPTFSLAVSGGTPVVNSVYRAPSGDLYVSGIWDTFNGVSRRSFTRLLENGTVDAAFLGSGVLFGPANIMVRMVLPFNPVI